MLRIAQTLLNLAFSLLGQTFGLLARAASHFSSLLLHLAGGVLDRALDLIAVHKNPRLVEGIGWPRVAFLDVVEPSPCVLSVASNWGVSACRLGPTRSPRQGVFAIADIASAMVCHCKRMLRPESMESVGADPLGA